MSIGAGIAIAGIWIGVGLSARAAGESLFVVAAYAATASILIALFAMA